MPRVGIDTNEGHGMEKDAETRIREIQAGYVRVKYVLRQGGK